jgi:hypothetical protein
MNKHFNIFWPFILNLCSTAFSQKPAPAKGAKATAKPADRQLMQPASLLFTASPTL